MFLLKKTKNVVLTTEFITNSIEIIKNDFIYKKIITDNTINNFNKEIDKVLDLSINENIFEKIKDENARYLLLLIIKRQLNLDIKLSIPFKVKNKYFKNSPEMLVINHVENSEKFNVIWYDSNNSLQTHSLGMNLLEEV